MKISKGNPYHSMRRLKQNLIHILSTFRFYVHPTVAREDSYTTSTTLQQADNMLSSSNVLAGGVPKASSLCDVITADQAHTF